MESYYFGYVDREELNSILETAYLFQSPENAVRLLDALQRVKAKTNQPQTIEELRKEFNLYKM
ncbi:hypothetical protein [Scytonema sp. NUACC26]|uniref:hypothetical protein n=1 Tax=Scytonema sp. NUACC26 TaxID=3140176 RepID=UPI0034DBAB7E